MLAYTTNHTQLIVHLPKPPEDGTTTTVESDTWYRLQRVISVLPIETTFETIEIIIPEGYTAIGKNAFSSCLGTISKVTLPSTLTHIGEHAFYECQRLQEINLERVKHIGNRYLLF